MATAMLQLATRPLFSSLTFALLAVLACASASRAQFAPPPSQSPQGAKTIVRDVSYVLNGSASQKLDLYVPGGAGKHPLIVYIHGGAWMGGDKNSNFMPGWLIAKGWAVASLNYRLSNEAIFPAQIQDCKAAVRWLRAHATEYNLDPNRFVSMGESAGGHLASLLGTTGDIKKFDIGENLRYSSAVQAVVDEFGPTDLIDLDKNATPGSIQAMPNPPEAMLIGGPVLKHEDLARSANPIVYIDAKTPPFFICHGANDTILPIRQSQLIYQALIKSGHKATYYVVPGANHMWMGASQKAVTDVNNAIETFLVGLFPTNAL